MGVKEDPRDHSGECAGGRVLLRLLRKNIVLRTQINRKRFFFFFFSEKNA